MKITINIKESKNTTEDYSAYITFNYNEELISFIKSFRQSKWHKDSKEWEIRLFDIPPLLEKYSDCIFEIIGEYVDLSEPDIEIPDDFTFKTDPFEHQVDGFFYGLAHTKWLLGDSMGLGKTKQAIDIAVAEKLGKGYNHCLIICGVNGLKWNWKKEIEIHSDETGYIIGERRRKNGSIYIASTKEKLEDLENLPESEILNDNYFLITNIESLRNDAILAKLAYYIDTDLINMIVIDEAHKGLKNTTSQQGKALLQLHPEYRLAMTGTPLMNTPLDLYGILRWLGYETHSYYQFKNHYAIMGGFGGYEIVGYKHLDELEDLLDSIMLRRLKENVLDLPDKLYIDEYVDMLPKQKIIYNEVTAEIKMNIDKIEVAANPLAEMIRMRQATGWTGILSEEVACSAKIDRLIELVEEITANNRKVVVFSNWSQITDVAYDYLCESIDCGIAYITGEVSDAGRNEAITEFQEDDDVQVIIGTTSALGTGFTLTAADTVIFLDHPWSRALYEQAVDRTHRIGQNTNVTIYNLMCKDTIDEKIWDIVQRKGIISDVVVDNMDIPENKKELVRYLLS